MKITLFFCAGNLAERLGVYKVSQMNGVGKRMPLTMAAFSVAALGMIGLPPIAGFVSKWFLGTGAIEVGAYWVLGILAASSLLNALYFLPILHAAWFKSPGTTENSLPKTAEGSLHKNAEGSWMLWLPPVVTTTLAVAVGLFANASVSPLSWVELIAAREYGRELVVAIESLHFSHWLLEWVVFTPLLLILGLLIPGIRRLCVRIAPLAALPALWMALGFSPELSIESNSLPGLFFGGILSIDHESRVMLMLSAILWLIVGLYGQDYLSGDKQVGRYTLCLLLCMAGSFGLILSQDLFGFITFFTLMSFAAYGFVVHSGSSEALRAGKTYIQWVVIGEVLLFAALVGLVITGGSTHLIDMERSAQPPWVSWLLLIGFGIKAGLLGMHFWLPRAHPVAPVPASALLSGLMVKAGLLGWWRFLPLGEVALIDMGQVLITLGFGGAFIAVIAGVVQNNPKTLLAYSTISQMGIVAAGVGTGLLAPSLWPLLSAALLLYAVHHGLAKSALFLSVGLTNLLSPAFGARWFVWLLIAIPALAMVGLPLTSGALAKFALKYSFAGMDWLTLLLPITAIGTTLLMLRFIVLLRQASLEVEPATTIKNKRFFSYTVLVLLLIGLVYWIPQAKIFIPEALAFSSIWNALWPVIAGSFIFLVTHSLFSRITPIPAGDLIFLIESAINSVVSFIQNKSQSAKAIIAQNRLILSGIRTVSNGKQTAGLFMRKQVTNKLVAIRVDPGIVFISTVICLSLAFALNSTL